MNFSVNALGRKVPTVVNGRPRRPFVAAYDPEFRPTWAGGAGVGRAFDGSSKVTTLDRVLDLIEDGDWISYPHYYRTGDVCLQMIVGKLRERGLRGIHLYGNAFFDNCDPWLYEACRDGVLAGFTGSPYRKVGAQVVAGDLLPWVAEGYGHGSRVRRMHTGEVRIKVAFGPVPYADIWGNASGFAGSPEHYVGPLGLFTADTEYAAHTCLLAGQVVNHHVLPRSLHMQNVDFVVPVDCPGNAAGVGSGTLDLDRIRANKFNSVMAGQVLQVMKAAEVIRDGFNFQVGSGTGLIVLDELARILGDQQIQAGFAVGGCTSLHVEMLKAGLIRHLLHGQCFQPSEGVMRSMREDKSHFELTTGDAYDFSSKQCVVDLLDVAVLSCLEVDRNFNANTVCANGRIIGGIGGAQGVAAGAKLTIMFLPLATGKKGRGFPRVVEDVYTVVNPGEVVDVVVTEEHVAVNPISRSPSAEALKANAQAAGLKLVSIDELVEVSRRKALDIGKIPARQETTDEVVQVVEYRDGTLIDAIRKPAR